MCNIIYYIFMYFLDLGVHNTFPFLSARKLLNSSCFFFLLIGVGIMPVFLLRIILAIFFLAATIPMISLIILSSCFLHGLAHPL